MVAPGGSKHVPDVGLASDATACARVGHDCLGDDRRSAGDTCELSDSQAPYRRLVQLRRDGLIWRRAGKELIALDLVSSQYFAANETAAAIWEALAAGAPAEELAAMLCDRFDVEPEVARADTDRLLDSLRAEGLIESANTSGQP
jgi:hypothetical protein